VYGFGAEQGYGTTSHCFSLNGKDDAEIEGLENIIEVYKKTLKSIKLSGPTNFSEIIDNVKAYCR